MLVVLRLPAESLLIECDRENDLSVGHSIDRSVGRSVSIGRSLGRSVGRSVSRSIDRVDQSARQSISRHSIDRVGWSPVRSIDQSVGLAVRSINLSVDRSVGRSVSRSVGL